MRRSYSRRTLRSIVRTQAATSCEIRTAYFGIEQRFEKSGVGGRAKTTNEIAFRITVPSNIHLSLAPPALSASWSQAACDIPAPYFCPGCKPGCTDYAVPLQ